MPPVSFGAGASRDPRMPAPVSAAGPSSTDGQSDEPTYPGGTKPLDPTDPSVAWDPQGNPTGYGGGDLTGTPDVAAQPPVADRGQGESPPGTTGATSGGGLGGAGGPIPTGTGSGGMLGGGGGSGGGSSGGAGGSSAGGVGSLITDENGTGYVNPDASGGGLPDNPYPIGPTPDGSPIGGAPDNPYPIGPTPDGTPLGPDSLPNTGPGNETPWDFGFGTGTGAGTGYIGGGGRTGGNTGGGSTTPQQLGNSSTGSGGGSSKGENWSQGSSEGGSTSGSTSTGRSGSENESTSKGRTSSDAKQTMDVKDVNALLGGPLAREANAANPYTRQQFAQEANRGNARTAQAAEAQKDAILRQARKSGQDPSSPAVQKQLAKIDQQRTAMELENSNKLDAQFRQMSGAFDQANVGQNIGQRGQDVQRTGLDANVINALFGQTKSTGEQDASSKGTSFGTQDAQSAAESWQKALNDAYGYNQAQNWFNNVSFPMIGWG
jgi:hypothetical protein